MRRLGWLILAFACCYAAVSSVPVITTRAQQWIHYQRRQRSIEDTVRSTAFILNAERWLEFPLPDDTRALRILTNAAVVSSELPTGQLDRPRIGWKYAVEYELLDAENNPIFNSVYHLRTKITSFEDPDTGETMGISWFRDSDRIPAQTRTIQIPTDRFPQQARQVRIRLSSHEPQVEEVVARVYMKYERPNYDHPYMWRRLSASRRERISRASVYPPELLSANERLNLLRWNWAAVAPLTRPGARENFRRMYQRDEAQPDAPEFLPLQDAIAISPGAPVTLQVPETPGKTTLSFYLDEGIVDAGNAHVEITYHAQVLGVVSRQRYALNQLFAEDITIDNDGNGIIEVVSNDHVMFSAQWLAALGEKESELAPAEQSFAQPIHIAASTRYAQLHLLDDVGSLTYTITHRDEATPLPFRVSCRRLTPDFSTPAVFVQRPQEMEPVTIHYECLSDDDQLISTGSLETSVEVSLYDHAKISTTSLFVSEPRDGFLNLPSNVAKVRFRCAEGLAGLMAFTRPADLPRRFRIPEEQDWSQRKDGLGRSWFVVRPDRFEERLTENLVVSLRYQARPPEPNEDVLTGNYELEELTPSVPRVGRFVLSLKDSVIETRDAVAGIVFRELSIGKPTAFRWSTQVGLAHLAPRLIYLDGSALDQSNRTGRNSGTPITMSIDGEIIQRFSPRVRAGEVALPPIAAEDGMQHELLVDANSKVDGLRLFARGLEFETDAVYLKRFGYEINTRGTESDVIKYTLRKSTHEEESFVMRLFFTTSELPRTQLPSTDSSTRMVANLKPKEADSRERVLVRIGGTWRRKAGVAPAWTLSRRLFDIQPIFDGSSNVLDGKGRRTDTGHRCMIVLDEDLPPGDYPIEIERVSGSTDPAYVTLYRLVPASTSDRAMEADSWIQP